MACGPAPERSVTATTAPPATSPPVVATSSERPTASATATPAPHPLLSDRYGLIVFGDVARVRSERDPAEIGRLRVGTFNDRFVGDVSSDGRKVAYWGSGGLWVTDLSNPAQPRQLLILPDGEFVPTSTGGGLAWSSDGTGLLFAIVKHHPPQPEGPPDHSFAYSTLRQLDLATGTVREVLREAPGFPFFPLAWDRAKGISAAVSWGPGGFAMGYIIVRDDGTRVESSSASGPQQQAETGPGSFHAAPDAGHVLLSAFFDGPAEVWVWPLADRSKLTVLKPREGDHVVGARWRNADEILVSISTDGDLRDGERLDLWSLDGSRRSVVLAKHSLEAVRPDGTAAITNKGLVDLATGVFAPIPGYAGGAIASVVIR